MEMNLFGTPEEKDTVPTTSIAKRPTLNVLAGKLTPVIEQGSESAHSSLDRIMANLNPNFKPVEEPTENQAYQFPSTMEFNTMFGYQDTQEDEIFYEFFSFLHMGVLDHKLEVDCIPTSGLCLLTHEVFLDLALQLQSLGVFSFCNGYNAEEVEQSLTKLLESAQIFYIFSDGVLKAVLSNNNFLMSSNSCKVSTLSNYISTSNLCTYLEIGEACTKGEVPAFFIVDGNIFCINPHATEEENPLGYYCDTNNSYYASLYILPGSKCLTQGNVTCVSLKYTIDGSCLIDDGSAANQLLTLYTKALVAGKSLFINPLWHSKEDSFLRNAEASAYGADPVMYFAEETDFDEYYKFLMKRKEGLNEYLNKVDPMYPATVIRCNKCFPAKFEGLHSPELEGYYGWRYLNAELNMMGIFEDMSYEAVFETFHKVFGNHFRLDLENCEIYVEAHLGAIDSCKQIYKFMPIYTKGKRTAALFIGLPKYEGNSKFALSWKDKIEREYDKDYSAFGVMADPGGSAAYVGTYDKGIFTSDNGSATFNASPFGFVPLAY